MISPGWTRLQKLWDGASCSAVHTAPQCAHAYWSVVSGVLLFDIGGLLHVCDGFKQPDGHIPGGQAHMVSPPTRPAHTVCRHLHPVAVRSTPRVLSHDCVCGDYSYALVVEDLLRIVAVDGQEGCDVLLVAIRRGPQGGGVQITGVGVPVGHLCERCHALLGGEVVDHRDAGEDHAAQVFCACDHGIIGRVGPCIAAVDSDNQMHCL